MRTGAWLWLLRCSRAPDLPVRDQHVLHRRQKLLEWSRSWITRETLDERIQHALDNPSLLFPGEDLLKGSGFDKEPADPEDSQSGQADLGARAHQDDDEYLAELDILQEGSDNEEPHRP